MWNFAMEKKGELIKQKKKIIADQQILKAMTPTKIWRNDLDELLNKLNQVFFMITLFKNLN